MYNLKQKLNVIDKLYQFQVTLDQYFITCQKLDCLAQHEKKLLNQNDTTKWKKSIRTVYVQILSYFRTL